MKRLGYLHKYYCTALHAVIREMRLHHYAPAVPNSYCVGVHNGHGFGSLFAKLFSKVAAKTVAKTAAKAALRVAKTVGRKAASQVVKEAPKILKKVGKTVIDEGTNYAGKYVEQKLGELEKKALNTKLPPSLVHSVADAAKGGVKELQTSVPKLLQPKLNSKIDEVKENFERAAGIEKKRETKRKVKKAAGKINRGKVVSRKRQLEVQHLNKIIHESP